MKGDIKMNEIKMNENGLNVLSLFDGIGGVDVL